MAKDKFVYVTYILSSPQKVWDALLKPEFTRLYWSGVTLESDWNKGAPWAMVFPGGKVTDRGEVLQIEKPKRLVMTWRNEFMPELTAEGFSRCTMELEPVGDATKLTVIHEIDVAESKLIKGVSGGWPRILSSLKSLLETGQPLSAEVSSCSPQTKASSAG